MYFDCDACLGKSLCFSMRWGGYTGEKYFQLLASIRNRILFWTDFCPYQFWCFIFLCLFRSKDHHRNNTAVILSNLSIIKIFVSIVLQEQFIVIFLKAVLSLFFQGGLMTARAKADFLKHRDPGLMKWMCMVGFDAKLPPKPLYHSFPKGWESKMKGSWVEERTGRDHLPSHCHRQNRQDFGKKSIKFITNQIRVR